MRSTRRTVRSLSILGVLLLAPVAAAARPAQPDDLEALALTALTGELGAEEAVAALRNAGETGAEVVAPLLAAWDRCTAGACDDDVLESGAARDALDRICGVRDCADLRLFWYTDLDAATATARREGKAVLSLRLLGRLDEELSCANSRFFRTVFYPDPAIARVLRESYVLHWRSVAPVPMVTIELADGRSVKRTVVGNSLHYVLDGHGRPVLALPGLMGPRNFRSALASVAPYAAGHSTALDDAAQLRWAHEAWRIRRDHRRSRLVRALRSVRNGGNGAYLETGSKAPVFAVGPALGAAAAPPEPPDDPFDPDAPSDHVLRELAQARRSVVNLSPESRAFLLAKHGETDPERGARLIESFEATLALDEVIDLYRMEPKILDHLLEADEPVNLENLTDWIYREVFRTPLDDPFFGLVPDHVYAALPAATTTARRRGGS